MSKWSCPVVAIPTIEKHPNADALEVITVEGTVCLAKIGDFKVGDLAVLVPIDSVVPTDKPVFAFLKKANNQESTARIRAIRLRGIFSDGLLVPLPPRKWWQRKWKFGQDASKALGVIKYEEEPIEVQTGLNRLRRFIKKWTYLGLRKLGFKIKDRGIRGPKPVHYLSTGQATPVYDLDKYAKYRNLLEGQDVVVTEKLHGMNCRIIADQEDLLVGSHHIVGTGDPVFHKTVEKYDLKAKMAKLPGFILFGEVLGTQDLKYGFTTDDPGFAAFDLYEIATKRYLKWEDFLFHCNQLSIPVVPQVYRGAFMPTTVEQLVNGDNPKKPLLSLLDNKTLREGVVVKLCDEAPDARNRVGLKFVSEAYLLRSNGTEKH